MHKPRFAEFLSRAFLRFFQTESSGGVILILTTAIAFLIANSSFGLSYHHFWQKNWELPLLHKSFSLHAFINEGIMTFFFLLMGLEIKREFSRGELASFKKATLPLFAALGGMLVPALIYILITRRTPFVQGFGIPMATDIAFSLGILSLLKNRVPAWVKMYVTSLAIMDDMGGVLVIALFYTQSISFWFLGASAVFILMLMLFSYQKIHYRSLYFVVGALLWTTLLFSGIHATLAGIVLALFLPPLHNLTSINQSTEFNKNLPQPDPTQEDVSIFEHRLHQVVSYLILPLFALCNAAIVIPTQKLTQTFSHPVFWAITFGLFLGKPIGIFFFSYGSAQLKLAEFPKQATWQATLAASSLAGIGFTMSLFMTELSFVDLSSREIAKLGILSGSLLSAMMGSLLFLWIKKPLQNTTHILGSVHKP